MGIMVRRRKRRSRGKVLGRKGISRMGQEGIWIFLLVCSI
jgi:hypothetical protein